MGSLFRQALALLTLAFIPAIGHAVVQRHHIQWDEGVVLPDEVTLEQADAWGSSVLWVDARPDEQFAKQHVEGAISLNEDRWNELLPAMLTTWSPDKHAVVYCSTQSCSLSHQVAKRLREEAGLKEVYVLHGGWERWLEVHK
ncbi:MAG: rhodanese-like domain-containing protein [Verrucomicrobiota bacterium]|nr:rhodanese-like domain-containing protein [Verrucomicrobiota bacterium]